MEHQLLPYAKGFLSSEMCYNRSCMAEEVPSPWGCPDLVAFDRNPDGVGFALPEPGIRLLCLLRREAPIQVEDLQARLGMGRTSLEKLLRVLDDSGLIRVGDDGSVLSAVAPPPLRRLCAVEMKVRDWRSGLRQAFRYKSFSDRTYLFLGSPSPRVDISQFSKMGVGLVSLPGPNVILPAKPSSESNVQVARMLVENRIRSLLS